MPTTTNIESKNDSGTLFATDNYKAGILIGQYARAVMGDEPAAFGAYTALKNAGRENDALIVSVDGGCAGVRGVVAGFARC